VAGTDRDQQFGKSLSTQKFEVFALREVFAATVISYVDELPANHSFNLDRTFHYRAL
jgi:hypothetical protein